jgi:hypothetical protein
VNDVDFLGVVVALGTRRLGVGPRMKAGEAGIVAALLIHRQGQLLDQAVGACKGMPAIAVRVRQNIPVLGGGFRHLVPPLGNFEL